MIRKTKNAKTVYAHDIDDLCNYLFFTPQLWSKLSKKVGCPKKTDNGFDVLEVMCWYAANEKLTRDDKLAPWREPSLQKNVEDAAVDLKKEQALYTKARKERELIRLQRDRGEVVEAAVRDVQELERFNIVKGRLYEAGRINAPELIKSRTPDEMSERFEDALDTAFILIQKDFKNINAQASKLEEIEEDTENVKVEAVDDESSDT